MKLRPILAMALALFAGQSVLPAQSDSTPSVPPGAKVVPQRNFAVCFLFAPTVPELYFRDACGAYRQLQIDTVCFGAWNIIPASPALEIFHKVETPETQKIDPVTKQAVMDKPASIDYQLVQTWPLPEGTDAVRKLYYYDAGGKVEQFLLDPGSKTHGPLQARVINLLSQVIGVRLGDQSRTINPSQDLTITAATTDGLFGFQYGLERKDSPPYVSPLKNLRFLNPQQRVTILVGYLPVIAADHARVTGYSPEAIRFFEDVNTIPKPPKPAIIPQKIARR